MLSLLKSSDKKTIKPVVLLVLDGFGLAPDSPGNAITSAKTPNIDSYYSLYPHGELIASSESVGLPANEAGNSEVGHLTIGAGRAIYQSLPRINMSITDHTFEDNQAFLSAIEHSRKNNSKLHLIGLVSSGTVHSSTEHLYALLDLCRKKKFKDVYLHLFTDGRDAPPQDGKNEISKIIKKLEDINVGTIATISGRYYAMDRDGRWERTKKVYDVLVTAIGIQAKTPLDAIKSAYLNGQTDEFIEPTVIVTGTYKGTIDDNDAVIFFNFRIDRPRQLTMALILPNFEKLKSYELGFVHDQGRSRQEKASGPTFKREKWPQNLFFVTMTEYKKGLPVSAIAYPPREIHESLAEILSKHKYLQAHLAESEKERMVTFYFDGRRDERFGGEDVEIIASPHVATYDKKPQMSTFKVVNKFKKLLHSNKYHFFVLNFANADMVAHSGNISATIKAIEVVDRAVGDLVNAILERRGTAIITADHGNAEELLSYPSAFYFVTSSSGTINTEHSNNPVPVLIISRELEGSPRALGRGTLADIAPTILELMNLPTPQLMTGRNLLARESTLEEVGKDQKTRE